MIRVLLLAVVLALALAAGAWALFMHSADHGHPITVGALEDAVKLPDPKLADERVAFASRAGFDALNITTAVGARPDAARSRRAADPPERRERRSEPQACNS